MSAAIWSVSASYSRLPVATWPGASGHKTPHFWQVMPSVPVRTSQHPPGQEVGGRRGVDRCDSNPRKIWFMTSSSSSAIVFWDGSTGTCARLPACYSGLCCVAAPLPTSSHRRPTAWRVLRHPPSPRRHIICILGTHAYNSSTEEAEGGCRSSIWRRACYGVCNE